MAGLTFVGMQKILDHWTKKATYSVPTLSLALTTTNPTANAIGTELTAGQYSTYARQTLVNSSWVAASGGSSAYAAVIDFTAAVTSSGTTVVGAELWDGLSNRIWWETFTGIPVTAGTHISFASSAFTATMSLLTTGNGFSTAVINFMLDHMTGKTSYTAPTGLFLALTSSHAVAPATTGLELVYTGYSAGGRPQLATGSIANAAVVGSNVDVVTTAQLNYGADTAGTQTAASDFSIYDSTTVGAGTFLGAGTISGGTGAVAVGLTPDFPVGSTILRMN